MRIKTNSFADNGKYAESDEEYESKCISETDVEADTETESESHSEFDFKAEIDAQIETDSAAETDTDTDTDDDEPILPRHPKKKLKLNLKRVKPPPKPRLPSGSRISKPSSNQKINNNILRNSKNLFRISDEPAFKHIEKKEAVEYHSIMNSYDRKKNKIQLRPKAIIKGRKEMFARKKEEKQEINRHIITNIPVPYSLLVSSKKNRNRKIYLSNNQIRNRNIDYQHLEHSTVVKYFFLYFLYLFLVFWRVEHILNILKVMHLRVFLSVVETIFLKD